MVPFLQILSEKLKQGVKIRLIHAREPGPVFRKDLDRFPDLWSQLERLLCPQVHFKCIIIDGKTAYSGSANLTGAGMGAKADKNRNFENGILTTDEVLLKPLAKHYDLVWRGAYCATYGRKKFCPNCSV